MMRLRPRAVATLLCLALMVAGLSVAPGGFDRPHALKLPKTLRSEAPKQQRPSLPSGQGVTWTASRGLSAAATEGKRRADDATVVRELPSKRSAYTRVFVKEDGTLRVREYLEPIHYRTPDGWKPIDNTVRPDPDMPGWFKTAGNTWAASFGPATLGVRLTAPEGNVRMVPVRAWEKADIPRPDVASVPEPTPQEPNDLVKSGIPEPGVVRYERVWRDTELRYEVHGGALKEQIRLLSREAPSRFAFHLIGVSLRLDDGGLRIADDLGGRFRIPPPTVTAADGSDLTEASGAHYVLGDAPDGRTRVIVGLRDGWLQRQPEGLFPLVIDPTLNHVAPTNVKTIRSNDSVTTTSPFEVGRQSTINRRAGFHFSQYETYLNQGYRVYFASVGFARVANSGNPTTISVYDQGPEPTSFDEIGVDRPLIRSFFDDGNTFWPFVEPAHAMDNWFQQGLYDQWFGVTGTESGNTLRTYNVDLLADIFKPPPPSRVSNLVANQVLSTTTPTLKPLEIAPSSEDFPTFEGEQPVYDFQITTAPAPGTGLAVSSGRMQQGPGDPPPTWAVPQGALQEGITYYAWVLTDWYGNLSYYSEDGVGAQPTVPPTSWGVPFKVKLGLGEGGPSPTDEVGAVPGQTSTLSEGAPNPSLPPSKITVNLVDGNASIAVGTPKLETLSGGIGLRFTYNSLAATTLDTKGVRASFYNDANNNGVIDPGTDPLVGERVDPTVAFDLGSKQRPVAAQDPNRALVEWNGFLTFPTTTSWRLGAISSDGIKITVDGVVRLDDYASHAPPSAPKWGPEFTPSSAMPIKIEWHHSSANRAVAQVFAQNTGAAGDPIYALQPDWLTRSPKVVPPGWTLNAAATSGRWVSLQDRGDAVTVYDEEGTGHEFRAAGTGTYTPPSEAPQDLLRAGPDGSFELQSAGLTYTFGPTGALTSLETAADDRKPAALEYGYSGSPPQLRTITDPVRCAGASPCPTSSQVTLSYGGDGGAPPGCSGAPTGLLCNIAYWDGTSTTLSYSAGRLARITNPGNVIYDFVYDGTGRLTDVRDPLANAAIAAGVRLDDATARTQITYSQGRVQTITQPAPSAGGARPRRRYCYNVTTANATNNTCGSTSSTNTTSVGVAGFNPTVGYAQQVKYDERNRIVATSDAAGKTTTYTWDEFDRLVAKIDPAGIETSTAYDTLGYPVASYGPAPSSSFEANGLPKAGADVPTATKAHDGGLSGLAAAWYEDNTDLQGNPDYHTTSDLSEDWSGACNSPSSCDGAGGIIPSSGFSGHLSGKLSLPQPGRLTLEANGGRVFVDDRLLIDRKGGPYASAVRADRPTSWWRLAETAGTPTATDSSGASRGTYSLTGVTLWQPGPLAGDGTTAASFNGSSGTVTVPDNPTLRIERTQPFSVEAWVKTGTLTSQQVLVSKMANTAPNRGWEFGLNTLGQTYLNLVNTWSSNAIAKNAAVTVADGAWHHVAATYDGSSTAAGVQFFIDGSSVAAVATTDSLTATTSSTAPLTIGSRAGGAFWLNGTLADVAVYPKVLAAALVQAHRSAGLQTSAVTTTPIVYNTPYPKAVNDDPPISYWRLSETSGTTAADSNGANAGTYSVGVTLGQQGALAGDPATAVSFNGTTGTVMVPDSPSLRFNQKQPFSVEAWVKTSTGAY